MPQLGARPKGRWSLDIIDRRRGFVPGNLRWATAAKQIRNRGHKTLGHFSLKELAVEVRRHGHMLTKIKSNRRVK
jgi:hypothetical protein